LACAFLDARYKLEGHIGFCAVKERRVGSEKGKIKNGSKSESEE